jgi:hypothetical protein
MNGLLYFCFGVAIGAVEDIKHIDGDQ